MATRKEIDGSAGVPQFYGNELRFKREEAGLTLEKLVDGSFFGITYLSEIEHGHRRMPVELAQHVDRVLKTDGFFQRRCEDVRKKTYGRRSKGLTPRSSLRSRRRRLGPGVSASGPER
ncbi:helix-turn-helix domain-containing protein [Streptomyces brevispora]|uniref:helix-turn-helix domain-containing protein n=1 Tax=Streptomyces brevispora TaxID=887462 RepID=UPI0037FFE3FC